MKWEDMEKVRQHTYFSELRISPLQILIMLKDALLKPKVNLERLMQSMFVASAPPHPPFD